MGEGSAGATSGWGKGHRGFHSPLQRHKWTGMSFLYWLDWKFNHFNWNVTQWIATQPSLRIFSRKLSNWSLAKVAKLHTNPYNFVACLPNPYKLSILGDIWTATIVPFSSSKYFYSWLRLLNLVHHSFECLSFSNKRKTTILFPSPLTFLQSGFIPLFRNKFPGLLQDWLIFQGSKIHIDPYTPKISMLILLTVFHTLHIF